MALTKEQAIDEIIRLRIRDLNDMDPEDRAAELTAIFWDNVYDTDMEVDSLEAELHRLEADDQEVIDE